MICIPTTLSVADGLGLGLATLAVLVAASSGVLAWNAYVTRDDARRSREFWAKHEASDLWYGVCDSCPRPHTRQPPNHANHANPCRNWRPL